jgi:hypothetical protein
MAGRACLVPGRLARGRPLTEDRAHLPNRARLLLSLAVPRGGPLLMKHRKLPYIRSIVSFLSPAPVAFEGPVQMMSPLMSLGATATSGPRHRPPATSSLPRASTGIGRGGLVRAAPAWPAPTQSSTGCRATAASRLKAVELGIGQRASKSAGTARRPASTPSRRRPGPAAEASGTRRASGRPARAMMISSPAAAASTRRESCVFAWLAPNWIGRHRAPWPRHPGCCRISPRIVACRMFVRSLAFRLPRWVAGWPCTCKCNSAIASRYAGV